MRKRIISWLKRKLGIYSPSELFSKRHDELSDSEKKAFPSVVAATAFRDGFNDVLAKPVESVELKPLSQEALETAYRASWLFQLFEDDESD